MEECGRGAAVEQLTARGMEYQSPRWGAIVIRLINPTPSDVSIPAMGAIARCDIQKSAERISIPAMGGNS